MLSGFKFKEELEERLIQSLSVEEATAAVAEAGADLEAWKASQRKKGKRPARPTSEEPIDGGEGTSGGGDKDQTEDPELEPEPEDEGKDKTSLDNPSGVEPAATPRILTTPTTATTVTSVGEPVVATGSEFVDVPRVLKLADNRRRNCSR
jgi:hypothetical protein